MYLLIDTFLLLLVKCLDVLLDPCSGSVCVFVELKVVDAMWVSYSCWFLSQMEELHIHITSWRETHVG
jgi:hypothetical protein